MSDVEGRYMGLPSLPSFSDVSSDEDSSDSESYTSSDSESDASSLPAAPSPAPSHGHIPTLPRGFLPPPPPAVAPSPLPSAPSPGPSRRPTRSRDAPRAASPGPSRPLKRARSPSPAPLASSSTRPPKRSARRSPLCAAAGSVKTNRKAPAARKTPAPAPLPTEEPLKTRKRAPNANNDAPFVCGWEGCLVEVPNRKGWKGHMAKAHQVDDTRAPDGRRCKHTACKGVPGPYGQMAALTKHYCRNHQSPNKHACQVLGCEASYDNPDSLRRHVQTRHSGKAAAAPRRGKQKASRADKENEQPVAGPSGHRHSSAEESSDDGGDEESGDEGDEDEEDDEEESGPQDVKDKGKGRAYDYDDYDDDGELEYV
ncbi:hypothetical protein TRAPUB_12504 [Trametes pubescens]|uniref:C2H2-type domain-containing protein n=1 Tax=Trametes pubescens TaxID=154538 RepID=A0A1M2VTS3_TRAPU|nr:hypothetical protein TRAPUB_12504 [Trametes pubescens]